MKHWLKSHAITRPTPPKPSAAATVSKHLVSRVPVTILHPAAPRLSPAAAAAAAAAVRAAEQKLSADIGSAHLPPATAAHVQADLAAIANAAAAAPHAPPAAAPRKAPVAPPPPPSTAQEIQKAYAGWRRGRVRTYLAKNHLYTASDFCNTQVGR
jgi:hypothetical protein